MKFYQIIIKSKRIFDNLHQETKNRIEIDSILSFSHLKYLTMDKTLALISSFNLLAFAGEGKTEEDISYELGVVLSNDHIIEKI